ncbi:MAG TPA: hypothetical protein VF530_21390 [Planctomycetota bacterium]
MTLALLAPQQAERLDIEPGRSVPGALPSFVSGGGAPLFARVVGGATEAELVLEVLGAAGDERVRPAGGGWFLNWADIPAVARLEDGTTLAVWLETTQGHAHSYGTRFQLFDAAGDPQAEPRRLEEHAGPGEHGFVSLVPLDAERFLALWLDGRSMDAHGGGHMQVLARTVARDGTLGPETVVDPSACSCCPTHLVRLADGTVLAAWRDRSEDEVRDISLARFDGARWSAPAPLHADGWEIHGCPVNGPRLAASATHVAAAWYTGIDGSVRVAFGAADGSAFAAPVRVDEGGGEGRGDAVFLADGALLVGWLEHDEGRVAWKLRRVWPDGRLGSVHVLAPISGERAAGFLRLAPAEERGAWALWTEPGKTPHVLAARVAGS